MGTAVSVDEQLTDYSIRLYPNPVNQGRLNLSFSGIETQEVVMHIMDAKGKQVMAESFEASAQQTKAINIQHLQPGVYVMQLRSSKLVYQQKFVVVR
jgi:methionine-rich copper-binding protein CopC